MTIYDSAQGRRSAILIKLREDSSVTVAQLSRLFGVSEVTIRKDLSILKERKLLIRVHGGAILESAVSQEETEMGGFNANKLINVKEKEAIGRAAAAHIKDGDTIMIDSGTTALEVARNLHAFRDLTIITNSVYAMLEALKYNRFKVILLGGLVRGSSLSTVGALAESNLKLFYGYNSNTAGKICYYIHKKADGRKLALYACYRKADGVIGMYDVENDVFYTNNGSGDFTKGQNI